MVSYENFIVPELYYNTFLKLRKINFVNEYYKNNRQYPSFREIEQITLNSEDKERLKRRLYNEYLVTGKYPNININPNIPSIPPDDTNNNNEEDIIVPPSNSETVKNIIFKYTMDDIPESVGIGDDMVGLVFKNGIINGDLLDVAQTNIVLKGADINITINNINDLYVIPVGEYNVSGNIGKLGSDLTCLSFNENVVVNEDGVLVLHGILNSSIVMSNKIFKHIYYFKNLYGEECNGEVHTYNNYYYTFINKHSGPGGIYWRKFVFDNITYKIDVLNEWEFGTYYYYHIE